MVRLIIRAIRMGWFLAKIGVPIVWKVFKRVVWLMALTLASIFSGIPPAVDKIAYEWMVLAVFAGWPSDGKDRRLYIFLKIFAYATLIAGWVLLSFITTFIVRWIF